MANTSTLPWIQRLGARRFIGLIIAGLSIGLLMVGALAAFDRILLDQRFKIDSRPAGGSLVIVDIDARSLQALDTWPWPRSHHAAAIERLLDYGASEIAYDVDFSAKSLNPEDDQALEAALARSNRRVILPTFHQSARANDALIEIIRTDPLPRFARHVQLGGVTLIPADDGLIRELATADRIRTQAPSGSTESNLRSQAIAMFPTLLAGPTALGQGIYMIDYAIDPASIPQVSFIDLLSGEAPAALFKDKKVIVGASATELGDLHATPVFRVLAGPTIQALGYESLIQNRALHWLSPFTSVILILLLAVIIDAPFRRLDWRYTLPITLVGMAAIEAVALWTQTLFPVAVPTAVFHAVLALSFVTSIVFSVESKALTIFRQHMAETQRRRLMVQVLQKSFDGVAITDYTGRLEVFNSAAARILGIDEEEAHASTMDELLPNLEGTLPEMPLNDTVGPVDVKVVRGDGTPIVIEITCTRLELDPSAHPLERRTAPRLIVSYVFRDVTARTRAEAATRKAKEAAIAANNAKTTFLANMSHELRSPLNAIIGFGEMIESEYRGVVDPVYRDYAGGIVQSGRHLLSVINDILHISKIKSGSFTLHEDVFDAREMLIHCVELSRGWHDTPQRKLVTALPEQRFELYGDETLLRQSVINLLSNAVKYSRTGDRITLRLMQKSDGFIIIEVSDTGIGIDDAVIPMLSKPFYQVDSAISRQFEGTGLGLSLVNSYVKAHDGILDIKSTLGVGTTVRIKLPPERLHRVQELDHDHRTDFNEAKGAATARIDTNQDSAPE